jgi:hypothetical protein
MGRADGIGFWGAPLAQVDRQISIDATASDSECQFCNVRYPETSRHSWPRCDIAAERDRLQPFDNLLLV